MRFPKNQSLVSDRNVARCRGEGRSGFTKRNNFRIKMIYGCIEDISITENFDAPKDRGWKNAASSMRSGKRLGGIPGSTRGPLSFGNVSISLCDEKPNEKGFKNTLFHFSWKEYHCHPTSWIQQCIQQCILKDSYKETICRWRFRSSWWGISEQILGVHSRAWRHHSKKIPRRFESLEIPFLVSIQRGVRKASVSSPCFAKKSRGLGEQKQNQNLGFYWKKRYGVLLVLPFSMNNTCCKHAN